MAPLIGDPSESLGSHFFVTHWTIGASVKVENHNAGKISQFNSY